MQLVCVAAIKKMYVSMKTKCGKKVAQDHTAGWRFIGGRDIEYLVVAMSLFWPAGKKDITVEYFDQSFAF